MKWRLGGQWSLDTWDTETRASSQMSNVLGGWKLCMHNYFKTLYELMVKGYRWNLFRCLDWYGFCLFKSHFISVTFYIQGYISERPSLSIVNILYSLKVLSPMWLSPPARVWRHCEQCKQRSGSSGKTKLLKLQTRCSQRADLITAHNTY